MTIPQESIEAGAKAMSDDWNPDRDPILTAMFRDYATSALTAALPALERQIRNQVVQEIQAAKDPRPTLLVDGALNAGMERAARIALGKGQL